VNADGVLLLWQVIHMLGSSLCDAWNTQAQVMSQEMAACIAVEALSILKELHSKGCVDSGEMLTTADLCLQLPMADRALNVQLQGDVSQQARWGL
jgi:hypothetical protein